MCQFTGILYFFVWFLLLLFSFFIQYKYKKFFLNIILIYLLFVGYNIYTLSVLFVSNVSKKDLEGTYERGNHKIIIKDEQFTVCKDRDKDCISSELNIFIKYEEVWEGEYSSAEIQYIPSATFVNGHPLVLDILTGRLYLGEYNESYSCDFKKNEYFRKMSLM